MKNSFFGDFFSSLIATFWDQTVKTMELKRYEYNENNFNHNINHEKINDLKILFEMYSKIVEDRNSKVAKYHLRQARILMKALEKNEASDLNEQIYEIQANLNLAYLAVNPYRG